MSMSKSLVSWIRNPDGSMGAAWNPLLGCENASEGCKHCYAARIVATRFAHNPRLPMYRGLATVSQGGAPQWTGEHGLVLARLDQPIRTRKATRVFVCNMGDLFFEGHSFGEIAAVFAVMAAANHHEFYVLTKRPHRMLEFLRWLYADDAAELREAGDELAGRLVWCHANQHKWAVPLPNVRLGVSAENQRWAEERIPVLAECPAPYWFVSMEPQLGPIDLNRIPALNRIGMPLSRWWVIQGGESGPGGRPFEVEWMRSLQEQCCRAGVAYYAKQLGAHTVMAGDRIMAFVRRDGSLRVICDKAGACMDEWLEDLRVRQRPADGGVCSLRREEDA